MDAQWIYQLSAGTTLIIAFLILVQYLVGRLTRTLDCLKSTLETIERAMLDRDQIILNHLEHFQATQERMIQLIERLCEAWEVNGRSR